jgi:hypothetical protein
MSFSVHQKIPNKSDVRETKAGSILSPGQTNVPVIYEFDSPFDIVSQAPGVFGGGTSALQELTGNVLQGNDGHGTIQFIGTFSESSWRAKSRVLARFHVRHSHDRGSGT